MHVSWKEWAANVATTDQGSTMYADLGLGLFAVGKTLTCFIRDFSRCYSDPTVAHLRPKDFLMGNHPSLSLRSMPQAYKPLLVIIMTNNLKNI